MNKHLKIIFFGTPDFVTPIVESLHQNFDLVAIVTAPDSKIGRKQVITPSAVAQKAAELGITRFKPERLSELDPKQLSDLNPDLFIVAAYGKIIPQSILDIPKFGALNVHPSKLPLYRGASPIQSALLNGDQETAITIIQMDAQMDHGAIVFQNSLDLNNKDNLGTLSNKMFQLASEILVDLIPQFIDKKIPPKEQNHETATFCKIIKKEDGYFNIDNPPSSEQLDRMIRAYFPWPNAWTKWNDKVVKFLPNGLVQMEGKSPVSLKDFLNGYPAFPIKTL